MRLSRHWPALAAAAFGLAVFLVQGGAAILPPGNTSWIRQGSDWGYHWVGWLYFRNADWGLPLGDTPNLFYPVGTTVGYMDGIPWLALTAKLASPILPADWQHVGLWLALCFALQGWFGARLTATFTSCKTASALGGALFVVAPVLLQRIRHEALCAHFLILYAIALCLRREERAPRAAPALLPAVAMGIHPYLALMVAGIVAAAVVRYWWEGLVRWHGALWRIGVGFAGAAALAVVFGYVSPGLDELAGAGFGHYNAELFTLVNPQGYSRILPDLAVRGGQAEGYGFLGLGTIVLGVSAVAVAVHAAIRRAPPLPWRRAVPLLVVAILFALFAFASRLSALGKDVLDLGFLYQPLAKVAATFRSSGRFIWVLAYVLTAGAMAIWLVQKPRLAPWVLGACVALQVADTKSVLFTDRFGGAPPRPQFSPDWELARGDFAHLALYPPRCGDGSGPCCKGFTPPPKREDMHLAALAARLGLTYNGYGAARVERKKLAVYCKAFDEDIQAGRLDPRTIYLVARDKEPLFRQKNPAATCRKLDVELACVSPQAQGPFRDRLAEGAPRPP